MDYTQHGYPGAEAAGPVTGHSGCGCSTSPHPTPFHMMPGPSMQSSEFGGTPGGFPGATGPTQAGCHQGYAGHAEYDTGSHQSPGGAAGHAHPETSHSAYMHHPPLHDSNHYGYYPHGATERFAVPSSEGYSILGLNLSDGSFWKGALIGTALTLLVTSETVQRTIMRAVVTAYSAAEDAIGELKEKLEDAQAELKKTQE